MVNHVEKREVVINGCDFNQVIPPYLVVLKKVGNESGKPVGMGQADLTLILKCESCRVPEDCRSVIRYGHPGVSHTGCPGMRFYLKKGYRSYPHLRGRIRVGEKQIGRAHVWTPVTWPSR